MGTYLFELLDKKIGSILTEPYIPRIDTEDLAHASYKVSKYQEGIKWIQLMETWEDHFIRGVIGPCALKLH